MVIARVSQQQMTGIYTTIYHAWSRPAVTTTVSSKTCVFMSKSNTNAQPGIQTWIVSTTDDLRNIIKSKMINWKLLSVESNKSTVYYSEPFILCGHRFCGFYFGAKISISEYILWLPGAKHITLIFHVVSKTNMGQALCSTLFLNWLLVHLL